MDSYVKLFLLENLIIKLKTKYICHFIKNWLINYNLFLRLPPNSSSNLASFTRAMIPNFFFSFIINLLVDMLVDSHCNNILLT
jgi:hypothetical protein